MPRVGLSVVFLVGVSVAPLLSARPAPPVDPVPALAGRLGRLEAAMGKDTVRPAPRTPAELQARLARLEEALVTRDSAVARRTPRGTPVPQGVLTSGMAAARLHPILRVVMPHTGVDLAAPEGTPVRATADGRVAYRFDSATYGLGMDLDHGEGTYTRFAHLSGWAVKAGEIVRRGQVIGWIGSTGRATGAHLHYEVFVDFARVDPAATLPGNLIIASDGNGPGDS